MCVVQHVYLYVFVSFLVVCSLILHVCVCFLFNGSSMFMFNFSCFRNLYLLNVCFSFLEGLGCVCSTPSS
jgi:hypothetical protein